MHIHVHVLYLSEYYGFNPGLFANFTVLIFIFLFVSLHSAVYYFNIYNFIFLIHFVRQLSQDWRSLHYETDILLHTIYEIISTTIVYYQ